MKRILVGVFLLAVIFCFSGCEGDQKKQEIDKKQATEEKKEINQFVVETDFAYDFEKDGYICDVLMPKVADSVKNGNQINAQLTQYNTLDELENCEGWNWSKEDSFQRSYQVSNKNGICSLNIILKNLKQNGDPSNPDDYYINIVTSYYYDENTGRVLSQSEYLSALGYTKDDILSFFNKEYGEKYSNRTYDFSHMIFWLDADNVLQFSTHNIDMMDCNTADFNLTINGKKYRTGSSTYSEQCPFGEAIKSTEKFEPEVWAGSWWIEAYYDGAYVLYSLHKDSGKRYPFHVEITKPNGKGEFEAYTYRNAAIGDTREKILALYPEINPEEQKQLNGTENLFQLEGEGGYLYLKFYFENDIVTKIAAGALID